MAREAARDTLRATPNMPIPEDDYVDKLVVVNRVNKVVKGGRRIGFAALVVVGDTKGKVGFGAGKAREIPEAIRKATVGAKRNMIRVPLRDGRTLHHDVVGRYGAGHVILRSAPAGTGIIAGGPMRAVFETLGVQDVVAKSIGTSNPHNMIKASFVALKSIEAPRMVAAKRGKSVADIVGNRQKTKKQVSKPTPAKAAKQAKQATGKADKQATPASGKGGKKFTGKQAQGKAGKKFTGKQAKPASKKFTGKKAKPAAKKTGKG